MEEKNHKGHASGRKAKRKPPPLNDAKLAELGLYYVARFSTSSAKFASYLRRKIYERGWEGEHPADVDAMAARYVELGYINDEQFAESRSGSLQRRGYGARRIDQSLYHAGISEAIRRDKGLSDAEKRAAVVAMAKKRRFGPFYTGEWDDKRMDKQLSAMLRAGHDMQDARYVLQAKGNDELEDWITEAEDCREPI